MNEKQNIECNLLNLWHVIVWDAYIFVIISFKMSTYDKWKNNRLIYLLPTTHTQTQNNTLSIYTDKLIISDPSELHDRSFMAHLNQLPWTAPLFTRKVEQTVLTGKHMTFCRVSNESISVVCCCCCTFDESFQLFTCFICFLRFWIESERTFSSKW